MAPQIQKQQQQIQRHRDDNIIIMLNGVPVVFVPQRQQQRQTKRKNTQKKTLSKGLKNKNNKIETRKQINRHNFDLNMNRMLSSRPYMHN